MEKEKLRIDKYLWSIRVYKTRSLAAEACQRGKVRFNGEPVKSSRQVRIGDRYEVKTDARKWVIEVTGLLANRVDYQTSLKYYLDLTPEEVKQATSSSYVFYTGKRKSKQGRPTKRDKRRMDDFLDEIE
ncbi:MAG: RNA-binding S4 domain-containing protein [Chitinophagaceae bacterium]|nr:RNA-binding S4 domain-containing protein [Chitinophagaceae bacterium]MCW5915514.1 RNA-binding S4 domain-containing protein [Chitinophagaceae bacterium]MCZ2397575.1 RNA-binding S4 domain-containing protein [Chitinophagales bacterium]